MTGIKVFDPTEPPTITVDDVIGVVTPLPVNGNDVITVPLGTEMVDVAIPVIRP